MEEEKGGREIWPAVPQLTEMSTRKLEEEEEFCSKLETESCFSARPELVW